MLGRPLLQQLRDPILKRFRATMSCGTVRCLPALISVNRLKEAPRMRGVITGRDVVLHAFTIVRLWGLRPYLRCLTATLSRRPTTLLAVVSACRG